jgi:hypothetical protein
MACGTAVPGREPEDEPRAERMAAARSGSTLPGRKTRGRHPASHEQRCHSEQTDVPERVGGDDSHEAP